MKKSIIEVKSFDFAIRIVKLYQYLTLDKKEYVLSKQLLRCGTSIGANVSEAQRGQSKPDFYAKMAISLKEASETQYWIRLLHATDYLTEAEYASLSSDIDEIISILVAICNSKDK
ncbi:MAG: four helix bundle protein [Clostridia bacterium]|nr:four helix bundle protein [Clostridia bacterium]